MNNNIVVLGRVSVGKSTLLNAILGHKYFQMGDGITTTEHKSYAFGKLNLIDIPGNIDNDNLSEYKSIIEDSMAVLYVCDAQSVCNTLQMIPTLISYRKRLSNLNIFPILNKIDEIDDINSVRKEFRSVIQSSGINGIELIEVSAKIILHIKLFISNSLDENAEKQLLHYVFGRNGEKSIEDISQNMVNQICKTSGYTNLEDFFEKFTKQSDHNLYIDIINNSHLMPIKTYLNAAYRYNLNKNKKVRYFLTFCSTTFCFFIIFLLLIVIYLITMLILSNYYDIYLFIGLSCLFIFGIVLLTLIIVFSQYCLSKILNHCIFSLDEIVLPKVNLTSIEATLENIHIIETYYVNSKYVEPLEHNSLIDYVDNVYFSGVKYSDFVFVKLHDKLYQIHGVFTKNKITEVTYVVEVIQANNKNKNPFRIMHQALMRENTGIAQANNVI